MKKSFFLLLLSIIAFASCSSIKNTNHEITANTTTNHSESNSGRYIASSEEKATIEQWKGEKGLKFVYRDKDGLKKSWGTLNFESWGKVDNKNQQSNWVARVKGKFVTGYLGKTEKFNVGKDREETRLVIRTRDGQFVTWKAIDDLLDGGFRAWDLNGDGKKETLYVIRYNGKFLNWAKARLEQWKNFSEPVLVVRDTADGTNNGKLLAWIAPEIKRDGKVSYRDPETGRFVSTNQ